MLHSRLVYSFKLGITTSISSFRGEIAILGYGTAFRTGAVRNDHAFIKRDVILHVQTGLKADGGPGSTFSGQLDLIEKYREGGPIAVYVISTYLGNWLKYH